MKCLSENTLDRIALQGQELPNQFESEFQHIVECEFCKSRFETVLSIHSGAQPIQNEKSLKLERLIESIGAKKLTSGVFTLSLMENDPRSPDQQLDNQTKLAAESPNSDSLTSLLNRGVFATAEADLLVRVIEDTQAHLMNFHLISPETKITNEVLLILPTLGLEQVTDPNGRASFSARDIEIDTDLKILVHTPKAVFDLSQAFPNLLQLVDHGEFEVNAGEYGRIRVDLSSEDDQFALHIVLESIQSNLSPQKMKVTVNQGHKWILQNSEVGHGLTFAGIKNLDHLKIHIY